MDRFDLGSVKEISNQFLPEEHRANVIINDLSAKGEIDDLKLKWDRTRDGEEPSLKLKAKFLEIEINEFESFPGLKNITGEVNIENEKGIIRSVSRDVIITKKDVFRAPLQLNQFSGSVNWDNEKYSFNDVTVKDDYMEAILNGTVKYESLDNLYVDINIDSPHFKYP